MHRTYETVSMVGSFALYTIAFVLTRPFMKIYTAGITDVAYVGPVSAVPVYVHASALIIPRGIQQGDQFRRAFQTDAVAGYSRKCDQSGYFDYFSTNTGGFMEYFLERLLLIYIARMILLFMQTERC